MDLTVSENHSSQDLPKSRSGESQAVSAIVAELWVEDKDAAVAFYCQAFGAVLVTGKGADKEGAVQLWLGSAAIRIAAANPDKGRFSPNAIGGHTGRIFLAVNDPDVFLAKALTLGATTLSPVADMNGWRSSVIRDPFGHEWEIAKEMAVLHPAVPAEKPLPKDPLPGQDLRNEVVGDPILSIRDLSVTYGTTVAVSGLSLQIARKEIFGLLGPNGAGKTSTLSAVEGLLTPRSGTVLVDGISLEKDPIAAKARMGIQLQATSFQSELSVKQIVRLYAGLYGRSMSDREITERLGEIGLEGDVSKSFKQLSGGRQQRLALFVAVIHEPALLLLDEPTSGLDPQSRRRLWTTIEHIRKDGGSILLTTHSMEEAQAVCDRVAIIDHGSVITAATPAELIARHQDDPRVLAVAHGEVTLEDVFIGLTGSGIRG